MSIKEVQSLCEENKKIENTNTQLLETMGENQRLSSEKLNISEKNIWKEN
jgi:hypothetical protein